MRGRNIHFEKPYCLRRRKLREYNVRIRKNEKVIVEVDEFRYVGAVLCRNGTREGAIRDRMM